jgi:[NiFe] hydrogenase assembly HybE family chaperone
MSDAPSCLPDPSSRLEAAFRTVYAEKMQGLAFVNAAVGVEAIGFAPWKHYWLGVMLTPWSMNLLLAPRESASWRPLPPGEKRRYTFPAGTFDFISAREDAIGEYLICSLFSPLLEFADHATARQTAVLAREALFDSANAEAPELPAANLTRPSANAVPPDAPAPLAQLEASLATPMSRRDLLHARRPREPR